MIGEAEVLKSLVQECLDYDPFLRPSIVTVCERIKLSKDACIKEFTQDFIALYQSAEHLENEKESSRTEIEYLRNKNELLESTIQRQGSMLEEMEKQQVVSH